MPKTYSDPMKGSGDPAFKTKWKEMNAGDNNKGKGMSDGKHDPLYHTDFRNMNAGDNGAGKGMPMDPIHDPEYKTKTIAGHSIDMHDSRHYQVKSKNSSGKMKY